MAEESLSDNQKLWIIGLFGAGAGMAIGAAAHLAGVAGFILALGIFLAASTWTAWLAEHFRLLRSKIAKETP